MIAKITPHEEMAKIIKIYSQKIENAQELANHAAEQLRLAREIFWDFIVQEYPKIKHEMVRVNVDHKTGEITLIGSTNDVCKMADELAMTSKNTAIKIHQTSADDATIK